MSTLLTYALGHGQARPIAPSRELAQIAKRIGDAETRVTALRTQLDARLFDEHERGVAIRQLALQPT